MQAGGVGRRQAASGEVVEARSVVLTLRSHTATVGIHRSASPAADRAAEADSESTARVPAGSRNGKGLRSIHIGEIAQSALANIPTFRGHSNGRVVVLCYHSIHPVHHYASATPDVFEEHIQWLTQHCDVVPFAAIVERAKNGFGSNPTVAITFDDGFSDNYTEALPILVRHRVPATFFITTGFIDRDPKVIGRLQRLWDAAPHEISGLSWSQIVEMRDAGMEVGAHTVNHPNLEHLGEDAVRYELARSKEILEDRLGESVTSLAYPFGIPRRNFSSTTMRLASSCGFERAAAVHYRRVRATDHAFAIPRLAVTGDSLEMLRAKILGKLDFVGMWQEHAPQWATRMISSSEGADRVL